MQECGSQNVTRSASFPSKERAYVAFSYGNKIGMRIRSTMKLFVGTVIIRVTTRMTVISESARKPARMDRGDLTIVVVEVSSTTPTRQ